MPEQESKTPYMKIITRASWLFLISLFAILPDVSPGQTVILHEGFEQGELPSGWTQQMASPQGAAWVFQSGGFPYTGQAIVYSKSPEAARQGSYNAVLHGSASTQAALVSPPLDLSGNKIAKLDFWHSQSCFYNQALNVFYKDGPAEPWKLLASRNKVLIGWEKDSVVIPSNSHTAYIAFQGLWDGGCGVCLDDIKLSLLTPYSVMLNIKDELGNPVQGAMVSFSGITELSDANGVALFSSVPEGLGIPYSIRKTGFAPVQGKLAVSENSSFDISIPFSRILYVKSGAEPGGDGLSWSSPFGNLDIALQDARPGDQVWLSEGRYLPTKQWNISSPRAYSFEMKKEVAIIGGFPGIPGQEGNRQVQNIDVYRTVLSGDLDRNDPTDQYGISTAINGNNAFFVIFNNSNQLDNTAILEGVYISGGSGSGAYPQGCAAYSINSSPTFSNCRFVGNRAVSGGVVYSNLSSPQFFACRFYGNTGSGLELLSSFALIDKCSFENNTGHGTAASQSQVTVRESRFIQNSLSGLNISQAPMQSKSAVQNSYFARNGASGLYADNASELAVDATEFAANTGYGAEILYTPINFSGLIVSNNLLGGIRLLDDAGSSAKIYDAGFWRNGTASSQGGGLYADGYSTLDLKLVRFHENKSVNGGGLYAKGASALSLENAELWGNAASGRGGAIYIEDCQMQAKHITSAFNSSAFGGLEAANSAVEISNSILWRNNGEINLSNGASAALSNSIAEHGYAGPNVFSHNPLFIDLESNELRLKGHSPAIDAAAASSVSSDINSLPRPMPAGGAPDMGAHERVKGIDIIGGFPIDNQNIVGRFADFTIAFTEPVTKHNGGTIRLIELINQQEIARWDVGSEVDAVGTEVRFSLPDSIPYGSYYLHIGPNSFSGTASGLPYIGTVSEKELNFTVHRRIIYLRHNATGSANGFDWTNAFTSLQSALDASYPTQQIWIAAGTYYPEKPHYGSLASDRCFVLKNNVALRGGFSGNPGTEGSASSRDITRHKTILSADLSKNDGPAHYSLLDNARYIIRNTGTEAQLPSGADISGLYFSGIYGESSSAVYLENSSLVMDSCFFESGHRGAAALSVSQGPGKVSAISNTVFSGNKLETAIFISGGSASLESCFFIGGMAAVKSKGAEISASRILIKNNHAQSLIGIEGGSLSAANMLVHSNTAENLCHSNSSAPVSISHATVAGNTFTGNTFHSGPLSPLSVYNSILWANSSQEISAGSIIGALENCIISGGDSRGAGIISTDPLFYDISRNYYTLTQCSPGIDAGLDLGLSADILGRPRPIGLSPDIGAYERSAGPCLQGSSPANAYSGPRLPKLVLDFSEPIAAAAGNIYIKSYATGSTVQVADVNNAIISGSMLEIDLAPAVSYGMYYAIIDSAAVTSSADATKVFDGIWRRDSLNFSFSNPVKYVMQSAQGLNNGFSWENAFTDLQDAIDASAPGDQIWVAQGQYQPSKLLMSAEPESGHFPVPAGVQLFGGFSGLDYIFENRSQQLYPTVLTAERSGANDWHIFTTGADMDASEASIDGFTLKAASSGAIRHSHGKLWLSGLVFSGNTAAKGGAVFAASDIVVTGCDFEGNYAQAGGALALNIEPGGTARIEGCTFSGNKASDKGGAIYAKGLGAASSFTSLHLCSNEAVYGSAIYSQEGSPVWRNILACGNIAGTGGTIAADAAADVFLHVTLSANTSAGQAAGYMANNNAGINIYNSIIWGNISSGGSLDNIAEPGSFINFSHTCTQGQIEPGAGNINADPLFAEPSARNYQLQPCSPAIDAGTIAAGKTLPSADLIGSNRIIIGSSGIPLPDMGAFETIEGSCHFAACPAGYSNCWLGCVSTDWFAPENWSSGEAPLASQSVLIRGPGQICHQPLIENSSAYCRTISIDAGNGAVLSIDSDSGGKLIIGQSP
jgi:predicted outer membrane repeat protein